MVQGWAKGGQRGSQRSLGSTAYHALHANACEPLLARPCPLGPIADTVSRFLIGRSGGRYETGGDRFKEGYVGPSTREPIVKLTPRRSSPSLHMLRLTNRDGLLKDFLPRQRDHNYSVEKSGNGGFLIDRQLGDMEGECSRSSFKHHPVVMRAALSTDRSSRESDRRPAQLGGSTPFHLDRSLSPCVIHQKRTGLQHLW